MVTNKKSIRKRSLQSKKRKQLIRIGAVLCLLLGVVIVIAFKSGSQDSTAVVSTGNIGTSKGDTAPDFSVPTIDEGLISLSALRSKPTFIFFMAYWCGTCIPEAQALAQLKQEYGDGLNILAIDIDPSSTPEALNQFKQAAGGSDALIWAFDVNQQVTNAYQVRSLDTTLLLDANGVIVYQDQFPSPYNTLKSALSEAGF